MFKKNVLRLVFVGYMVPSVLCAEQASQQKEIHIEKEFNLKQEFFAAVNERNQILLEDPSRSSNFLKNNAGSMMFIHSCLGLAVNAATYKKQYQDGSGLPISFYIRAAGLLVSSALLWSASSENANEREHLKEVEERLVDLQEKIQEQFELGSYNALRYAVNLKRQTEKTDEMKTKGLVLMVAALSGYGMLYSERLTAEKPKFSIREICCDFGLHAMVMWVALPMLMYSNNSSHYLKANALDGQISSEILCTLMRLNLHDVDEEAARWRSLAKGWKEISDRKQLIIDDLKQSTSIEQKMFEKSNQFYDWICNKKEEFKRYRDA